MTKKGYTIATGVVGAAILAAALLLNKSNLIPPGINPCVDPFFYRIYGETNFYTPRFNRSAGAGHTCGPNHDQCYQDNSPDAGYDFPMGANTTPPTFYPKPMDEAVNAISDGWNPCYLLKRVQFPGWDFCTDSKITGGRIIYHPITLSQLPPNQIGIYRAKYGCDKTPSPTIPVPTATVTPSTPPLCPTCPPPITVIVTRVVTPTITPHIGPAPTKTPCFGTVGGCPTPTP